MHTASIIRALMMIMVNNSYCSLDFMRVDRSGRLRWVGRVAHMGKKKKCILMERDHLGT
jgi:hypothetical protein